ncbi:MAG: hypothetical protein N3D11_16575, partial [Candidatus Sumerlaeia bacterium]|nr:hypothetical protein [Candidatus Sumerlaeia bacterium]
MSRYASMRMVTIVGVALCLAPAAMAQVPSGQVGYWPLDENGGTLTYDFQNGNHGQLFNGPTWTAGRFGACVSFDKVDDYIQLPPGMLNSNQGSIAMWFKTPPIWAASANYGHMFWAGASNSGDGGGDQNELHLYINNGTNNGRMRFFIEGTTTGGADVNLQTGTGTRYDDDNWHHVVATWDKTANLVAIYMDGNPTPAASGAHTGNPFTCNGVARLAYAWSGARYYGGLMDEVRLFNRALTGAEVAQLYAVVPTPPRGTVTRVLPSPLIFTGAPVTVRLIATPLPGGGQITVTETIPGGLTPTNITPSAGSASFASGAITWTVTLGTVAETLTYQITPTVGPTYTFPGTYVGMPGGGNIPIGGDNTLYGGLTLGLFNWHGNIGNPPLGAAGGNPSLPGSASFSGTRYTISGAGADVAGTVDRCYMTARRMTGDFAADATISWVNPGTHLWAKAGLMVRRRVPGSAARAWAGIRHPNNVRGREAVFEWRTDDGANAINGGESSWPNGVASPVKVRIVRIGDTISSYYWNTTQTAWVAINPPTKIPALTESDVALSLFVTSHQDNGDAGATTNTILATANFDDFAVQSVTPVLSAATRDIQAAVFRPNQPVRVTITLTRAAIAPSLTVTETVPTSWTVSNISHGGTTTTANVIRWNLTPFTTTTVLSYWVKPIDQCMPGLFQGQAVDNIPLTYPITGETMALSAYKRIIYIRNRNAADYATHDRNIINALGDVGVRVGNVTVPPARYQVIEVQELEDLDTYGSADGDLVFVSQTVGAGNTKRHCDDPIPVVMTEQANFDDSNQAADMWFSNEGAARDINAVNIINTTHPITQIFPAGNMTIYDRTAGQGQLGVMRNGFGPAVLALASNPTSSAEICLAVVERGASGLYNGGG